MVPEGTSKYGQVPKVSFLVREGPSQVPLARATAHHLPELSLCAIRRGILMLHELVNPHSWKETSHREP